MKIAKKPAQTPATTTVEKPLTQQQIRYARQRVEGLESAKVKAIYAERDADTTYCARYSRGGDLLTAEIRAGRFTVDKDALRGAACNTDLHEVLKFTKFPKGLEDAKRAASAVADKYEARVQAVRAEATRLVDALVLGDAASAVAALQAFAEKVF